ncbi:hypothetical protein DFH09DRAFT_1446435 [Mycena vulgaris]|nr:hypothetical protein DFH09DRAFT_1446435 [Mycena vulgaris]
MGSLFPFGRLALAAALPTCRPSLARSRCSAGTGARDPGADDERWRMRRCRQCVIPTISPSTMDTADDGRLASRVSPSSRAAGGRADSGTASRRDRRRAMASRMGVLTISAASWIDRLDGLVPLPQHAAGRACVAGSYTPTRTWHRGARGGATDWTTPLLEARSSGAGSRRGAYLLRVYMHGWRCERAAGNKCLVHPGGVARWCSAAPSSCSTYIRRFAVTRRIRSARAKENRRIATARVGPSGAAICIKDELENAQRPVSELRAVIWPWIWMEKRGDVGHVRPDAFLANRERRNDLDLNGGVLGQGEGPWRRGLRRPLADGAGPRARRAGSGKENHTCSCRARAAWRENWICLESWCLPAFSPYPSAADSAASTRHRCYSGMTGQFRKRARLGNVELVTELGLGLEEQGA